MKFKAENAEEEVVISGIGCKLPESDTLEEFAEKLLAGKNLVTEDDRKLSQGLFENLPEFSGKIPGTRKFDFTFFGISNIVMQCMDPMTQQIMERTFEAVVDAGINPAELRGTNTAVFSGTSISDFDLEWATNYRGGYGIMGRNRCMNANRVSYWLDLKGTSVSQDCTWANGVTNLLNGWESIKTGRCDTAIVSTANLQSNAEVTIQLNDLGFLSPDGVCRSFDDSANGYARSDAVVVFVLQRASMARRSYATVAHVFARCYGDRYNIVQQPLQHHWEDLFREFYSRAGIDADAISYLEGHGSGIKEEDAVELKAIDSFFCRGRRKTPLLVGSVKSNMGHAEASAASCGVLKALICLERGIIPGNLNFATPNSDASRGFQSGKLKLVDRNTPFPDDGLVAVNAYGFGGAYAHVVLKANGKSKVRPLEDVPRIALLAGRTDELMEATLAKLESMPHDPEYIALLNAINSKKVDKYLGRGYAILPRPDGAPIHDHQVYNEMKRPVWFVFSGMGSQWPKMGRRLMDLPVFRESIERSHKILESRGLDLIKIITDEDPKTFENILHSFVGIAAIQIALVDIMNLLKIVPDGMIGHSVGELGCSYADGCFTAEQMILSAYSRGRASIESNLIKGYMAAIGRGYAQIKDELPDGIEVACHNAADSCTISGPAEAVQAYVKELEGRGIFARTVNVSNIAYHSRYIKPAAPRLLKYLKEVIPQPKPRSRKWISTSNAEENWDTELARFCSPEYHTNNLLSSVLFEEGCKHIPSNAICIEIAPHGLLQAILKRSLGEECTNVALTNRTAEDPLVFLLQAIGKLFVTGLEPQVANLYPRVEFPVSRGTPSIHQLISWDHEVDLAEAQTRAEKKVIYSIKSHFLKLSSDCIGYVANDENIYPVSVFLYLVWNIFATLKKKKIADCAVVFENFRVECPVPIHSTKNDDAMVTLQKGTGDFEINTTHLIARGNISLLTEAALKTQPKVEPPRLETRFNATKDEVYAEFHSRGLEVGESFKRLSSVAVGDEGWRGEVDSTANWAQTMESMFQLQMLYMGEDSEAPKFPRSFQKLSIDPRHHLKCKSAPGESKGLTAHYDVIRNIVVLGGMKMKGFAVQELPAARSKLRFTHREFAPFMDPPLKDEFQYVDFCFGIVTDNLRGSQAEPEVSLLEVESEGGRMPSVAGYLENSFPHAKLRVQKATRAVQVDPKRTFDLAVVELADVGEFAAFVSEPGFVLARGRRDAPPAPGMAVVSRFAIGAAEELLLLKKKSESSDEPEFVRIPKNEGILVNALNGMAETGRQVYLVGYEEPERGVEAFKKRIQAQTVLPLRWIFVFDRSPQDSSEFYKEQARNGLATNVFCKGAWGAFLRYTFQGRPFEASLFSVAKFSRELRDCYIGFDFSRNLPEFRQVDFSGWLHGDRRVMGIATVLGDSTLRRDERFTWNLPEGCSTEEGASMPLAYFFSYYCIVVVGRLKPFENLLVTDGCTPLGLAAIRVGLSLVPNVYVTVADEAEAVVIRKSFPSIPETNIIFHEDKNFDVRLGVVTRGEFTEMIINQLEGEKLMAACNCLRPYGRIFHFGAEDAKKNVQLGTSVFLLSTSFYSVSQEAIANLKDEEKRKIFELMEKGIRDGVVKPLPGRVVALRDFQKVVEKREKTPRREKAILPAGAFAFDEKLFLDSERSYLVIGDETDVWIHVTRCLLRKGVRKMVVSHGGGSDRTERHANVIRKKGVVVREEGSEPDVEGLLEEARALGPIAAAFVVALRSEAPADVLTRVDRAFREKDAFLMVISKRGGAVSEICCRRNRSGLPSSNFIWAAEEALVGREMDLMKKLCGKDPVFQVSHATEGALDADDKEEMLREILPKTVRDFCNLGQSLAEAVGITELPTKVGAREEKWKELSPVFFVGGLDNDPVETLLPLAKNLIYPAWCIQLPHMKLSVPKAVSFVLPKLFEANSNREVFNIVGLSWGCYAAIEIARQIEDIGGSVGLVLVDCPHHNLKESLSANRSWESALLGVIQGFSKTVQSEALALDRTWSMKLNRIVANLELSEEEEENFRKAADFIYNSLSAVMEYELGGTRLLGPLTVVKCGSQSPDDRTISKMCNCISVRSIPGREGVASDDLRQIIHGSAVAPSMSRTTVHYNSWRNLEDFLIQQKLSDFNSLTADFRVTATRLKFSFTH